LDSNKYAYSILSAFIFGILKDENSLTRAFSTGMRFLGFILELGILFIPAESHEH
jgi:hypothetical protein